MKDSKIDICEFERLVKPLIGLSISRPWKGYGAAAFFELGVLVSEKSRRRTFLRGEACISIDWLWRVDDSVNVLVGSAQSEPKIATGLAALKGQIITGISIDENTLEIRVDLSNGLFLRSMNTFAGYPQWTISLPDGKYLNISNGLLSTSGEVPDISDAEMVIGDFSKIVAERWGAPREENSKGACKNCEYFCRLDGSFYLLDYGVCLSDQSPFDGRSVRCDSGCSNFCLQT